jgi:hypothetical protein
MTTPKFVTDEYAAGKVRKIIIVTAAGYTPICEGEATLKPGCYIGPDVEAVASLVDGNAETFDGVVTAVNWAVALGNRVGAVWVNPDCFAKLYAEAVAPAIVAISKALPKCECGAEKTRSNFHSTWCPKHGGSK